MCVSVIVRWAISASSLSIHSFLLMDILLKGKSILHFVKVNAFCWVFLEHFEEAVLKDWVDSRVPYLVVVYCNNTRTCFVENLFS